MAEDKYGLTFEVNDAQSAIALFVALAEAEEKAAQEAQSFADNLEFADRKIAELARSEEEAARKVLELADAQKKWSEETTTGVLNAVKGFGSFTAALVSAGEQFAKNPIIGISQIAVKGAASIYDLGASLIGTAVKAAGEWETLELKMKGVFGAEKGSQMLEFADKLEGKFAIPIDIITDRLQQLKSFNLAGGDLEGTMTKLSNVAIGTGGSFEGITQAIGKMNQRGTVTFREIQMLMSSGVDVAKAFNDGLGITKDQLENIDKLGLDGAKVSAALIDQLGKQYQGSMERNLESTKGLWFSITDGFEDALRVITNDSAWDEYKKVLKTIRDETGKLFSSKEFLFLGRTVADAFVSGMEFVRPWIISLREFLRDELARFALVADTFKREGTVGILVLSNADVAAAQAAAESEEKLLEKRNKVRAEKQEQSQSNEKKSLADFQDEKSKILTARAEKEKKLAQDVADSNRDIWKAQHDREVKLQKEALNEQLKDFTDNQNEIKKQLELRFAWEKIFIDARRDYDARVYRRQQEDETTAFKRGLEDRDVVEKRAREDRQIGATRSREDIEGIISKIKGGAIFSDLPDILEKAMKEAGISLQDIISGDGDSRLRRYFEEQERLDKRRIEDEERLEKRRNEDAEKILKRQQEDAMKRRELEQKQRDFLLEQNNKQLADVSKAIKNMKNNIDVRMKLLDAREFEISLQEHLLKNFRIRAKASAQTVAGT